MALFVSPQAKEKGQEEFQRAVGHLGRSEPTRRDFMKGLLAAGATLPIGAAMYFGYKKLSGNPVRTALIGAGDEGGVLITEHNPDYLEFVAVCDIRPSNLDRIFDGEPPYKARKGFKLLYGPKARERIKVYERYQDVLEDPNIEAVVIALPLHLHAEVAIAAMKAGKHVLCE